MDPPVSLVAGDRPRFLETTLGVWTVRALTFITIFGTWEIYGRGVSRALFAPISEVVQAIIELTFTEDVMVQAFLSTNVALVIGYLAAILIGLPVGLMMGRYRTFGLVLDPYVSFLYGIPRVALIPLLVIWFGIGAGLRVAIVLLSCIFPIIINTMQGVKEVDPELIDVGRVNCASERQIFRTIIIPASLPYIFTGLQVGLGQALIGVIVAEMTAIITGLGGLVLRYANFFETAKMFVPILYIATFSVLLTTLMRYLRKRFAPWEASY